jgi:multisubunit Na+/H+ antiporter MnhB subunit
MKNQDMLRSTVHVIGILLVTVPSVFAHFSDETDVAFQAILTAIGVILLCILHFTRKQSSQKKISGPT